MEKMAVVSDISDIRDFLLLALFMFDVSFLFRLA